ncbi:MAG: beta-ketoacyl-ACP synthase II [Chloroflexi bacterium]|nr:beta-ketoacyl-ACP synthase II [Chloroflexota bacterium]
MSARTRVTERPPEERIVITGIGPVTPIGVGVNAFWTSLTQGRSGARRVPDLVDAGLKVQIAADIPDFDPSDYMETKSARRMARFAQLAVAASRLAVEDAGLDLTAHDPERVAAVINTGGGGVTTISQQTEVLNSKGPGRVSAMFVPMMAGNMASCQVSIQLGLRGPALTSLAACAASIYAFIDGRQLLLGGEADLALTGGTESNVSALGISGLANMQALSRRNDDPEAASRPFDKDRDGFVFGEGAVVCVTESLACARERGARIYAEVLGGGRTADAYHITAPDPDGDGAARAMSTALRNSGLNPEEIGYICAHGTSTPLNDAIETRAIRTVFGDHADHLAVSSVKSMTGHLMGAAGALSGAATALALYHGVLPPTINHETPDPDCDLDYVPNEARDCGLNVALVNGFGFGGQNGVVALSRIEN